MNAPIPQTKDYEFQKKCEKYNVSIHSDSTTMTITVRREEEIPRKTFISSFRFEDLFEQSKWFNLFDSIDALANEIGCLLTDEKYKFQEESNKLNLYLLIKTRQLDDIVLEIEQNQVQSKETVIEDICACIKEMSQKIKLQEEKFALLELSPDYQIMYEEGLRKK